MSCIYPKWAWQLKTPNENGNHELTFQKQDREPDYRLPCNKCAGCQSDKRRDWGIRMYHESQYHEQNCFITLTYSDEYLPDKICPTEARRFIKALKKDMPDLRYFLTGEYGEKTNRPHYHAILFGTDFYGGSYDIDGKLYGHGLLDALWGMGKCSVLHFTPETAFYTAGYAAKKILNRDTFSLMSKRPPIGRAWLNDHKDNIRRLETIQMPGGHSYPVPRSYLNWLDGDETMAHLKENRKANTRFATDKYLDDYAANLGAKQSYRREKI